MAKGGKSSKSKPAGKQKIEAGPSGKMNKFSGAGPQKPDSTAQAKSSGKGAPFPKGGPSGQMHSFAGTKAQKPGRSSQS